MVGVRGMLGVALATAAALLLACALLSVPAFADAKAHGGTLQYVDCDQIQSVAGFQYNAGDGDQTRHINQDQEQVCVGGNDDKNNKDDGKTLSDEIVPGTIVKGTLPDTGGLSLPAFAAYALLVASLFSLVRLFDRRR